MSQMNRLNLSLYLSEDTTINFKKRWFIDITEEVNEVSANRPDIAPSIGLHLEAGHRRR